ncbi:MAG: amrA [Proteobacteria bacterium]|nr:amrA [Pseudomonadota bacterium]
MRELGPTLLILARQAIASRLGRSGPTLPAADAAQPALNEPAATFVTLTQHGDLRGCIGSLEAWRPLRKDVQENAVAAAFRDPRFRPLTADELGMTRVEVSLLSVPQAMSFVSEAEALGQLRPDIDGLILTAGTHRSTFLPQVWEQLPEPKDFLAHLKQKAGLPASYWGDDVRLERYGVEKWKEAAP